MESRRSKLISTLFVMTSPPINCLFDVNISSNFSISLHQAPSMFIKPQFRIHSELLLRREGVSEWKCLSQPEMWMKYFVATQSFTELHTRDTKWSPRGYSSVKKLPSPILCHDDSRDKLMFWQDTAMCWRAKGDQSPSVLGKRMLVYKLK